MKTRHSSHAIANYYFGWSHPNCAQETEVLEEVEALVHEVESSSPLDPLDSLHCNLETLRSVAHHAVTGRRYRDMLSPLNP